jgi:hypothetical protein
MSRLVKVDHVVLTLRISPAGAGMTKAEVDDLVNKRLSEGYGDVDIFPVKTNFGERGDPTDLVQLYVFKQYAEPKVGRPAKNDD